LLQMPKQVGIPVEIELDKALEQIGFGVWQVQMILTLCVGSLADSSEATLLSFLGPCAQEELELSNAQASFINSVVFTGAMAGAMFFGLFADCKGRRTAYALSLMILLVFGVFTYFTKSYFELLFCRGCVGFGLGGALAPFDFLAETVPANIRGICLLIPSVFWGIGSVLTVSAAWLVLGSYGWRAVALLCAVPVLFALLTVFYLPESPRWLLSQGRNQEAVEAIHRAASKNGITLRAFTLKPLVTDQYTADACGMFKPPFQKITLLLFVNWAAFGFCYYATIQFSAKLFAIASSNAHCSFAYENILVPALAEPLMIITSMLFVEKSRKLTQSVAYFSACLFTLLLGLPLSNSSLTASAFFARGCINVACSVTWVVTPEYYPTQIRATAHALFYNVARIGASLSSFWVYSSLSPIKVCGMIAGGCFLSGFAALFMPETAGHNLDEVHDSPFSKTHIPRSWTFNPFAVFQAFPSSDDELQKLIPT